MSRPLFCSIEDCNKKIYVFDASKLNMKNLCCAHYYQFKYEKSRKSRAMGSTAAVASPLTPALTAFQNQRALVLVSQGQHAVEPHHRTATYTQGQYGVGMPGTYGGFETSTPEAQGAIVCITKMSSELHGLRGENKRVREELQTYKTANEHMKQQVAKLSEEKVAVEQQVRGLEDANQSLMKTIEEINGDLVRTAKERDENATKARRYHELIEKECNAVMDKARAKRARFDEVLAREEIP